MSTTPTTAHDTPAAGAEAQARLDASRASSAQALDEYGLRRRQRQMRQVYEIVAGAQLHGRRDMSLSEIQRAFEARHGKRIDLSRVSARVYDLKNSGHLAARTASRACEVTGHQVLPVFAVARQGRLVQ